MAARVRPAAPVDVDALHGLILELARFHGGEAEVTGTPAMLARALFGDCPCAEALVAQVDQELAGIAVFHGTFSTYECLPGLWLEDLYVCTRFRGSGVGRALLTELARLTVERGGSRLEWHRAEWNEPALRFYAGLGAELVARERLHRLSGTALRALAENGEAPPERGFSVADL
jgi:GNAT superfamily N-acetyltransferase